ncbi:MAG: hypothetical protein WCK86_06980 [Planctomycetia bacterium]
MKDSKIRLHLRYLLRGATGLVLIVTLLILAGRWAERLELGFLRIMPGVSLAENTNRDAVVMVSRSRAAIRFPDQLKAFRAGDEVSRIFVLSSPVPSTAHRLGFFVSGDQRARAIPLLVTDFVFWRDLPIEYSVTVNGKVVSDGPIEQLSRPFFLDIPARFFISPDSLPSNAVKIGLKLRCIRDFTLPPQIPPALAFEYPFYRDGSAGSGSGSVSSEHGSDIRVYKHTSSVSR